MSYKTKYNGGKDKRPGGKERMIPKTFRLPESLWDRAVDKADGLMSLSAVVRRLLEMWVNDEIDIYRKK